jgi:hypothetical protein
MCKYILLWYITSETNGCERDHWNRFQINWSCTLKRESCRVFRNTVISLSVCIHQAMFYGWVMFRKFLSAKHSTILWLLSVINNDFIIVHHPVTVIYVSLIYRLIWPDNRALGVRGYSQDYLLVVYLKTIFQHHRLYSVEWKGGKWMVNWKGFGRKWSFPNVRYYPIIHLEGLRKTVKSQSA